uniref:ANK_REP_REGION domain-containing protein n=1 Tax=Ascaris lumbricoides TaxID=6252 RepID=A0A0M3HR85_ASCLU
MGDVSMVDKLLANHASKSPSIGRTNTLTELAQRRHGNRRISNASSTTSTHSGGSSTCAVTNALHMAIAHKQCDIVELLLKNGYDPNAAAVCHCKGNCAAAGSVPLTMITPRDIHRAHSIIPELCSTCAQLRVVSIIDQTPLDVAVRVQSTELMVILIAYGADVNLGDEDGNTPLMFAVMESPLSWHCLHTLIFFGAQVERKNLRGICPLDLAPELRKLQQNYVEDLFKNACCIENSSHGNPETAHKLHLMGSIKRTPQWRIHVERGSNSPEKSQSSKMPLSPKASAAPSVSSCSMLDIISAMDSGRRKSLVSLQLHRRSKSARDYAAMESVAWEQAWELLKKMATNPECLDTIQACL